MCAYLLLVPLLSGLVANARVKDQRIPVTVLTGFLGSGKTTLLNHLLTKQHGKRLAVIENEFGEARAHAWSLKPAGAEPARGFTALASLSPKVGIDDALLGKNAREEAEPEIIEMMNGCICCTVRQDLIVVLKRISERVNSGKLNIDAVVIETTVCLFCSRHVLCEHYDPSVTAAAGDGGPCAGRPDLLCRRVGAGVLSARRDRDPRRRQASLLGKKSLRYQ